MASYSILFTHVYSFSFSTHLLQTTKSLDFSLFEITGCITIWKQYILSASLWMFEIPGTKLYMHRTRRQHARKWEMYCQLCDEQSRGKEEQLSTICLLPSCHKPEKAKFRFDCRAKGNVLDCSHLCWILMIAVARGDAIWAVASESSLFSLWGWKLDFTLASRKCRGEAHYITGLRRMTMCIITPW